MTGEEQVQQQVGDEWACNAASNPLPGPVDVAIIGGGIVGCSAALYLARDGISVAVFEKGRVAGEQSGRNWGWVRQQGRSEIELPMMMRSLGLWKELAQSLGEDIGFTQGGSLYLAESAAELLELEQWLPTARTHGLDTRMLSARELASVLESDGSTWTGALYTASDARAEPSRAAPAIARAAMRAGARIVTQCAVRGIESGAGRVQGVVTEHGVVRAQTVICAAGAWTRLFCGSLGITVPQLRVLGTVARTAPAPRILDGEAWSPRIAIRRRADGGYTVAHGSSSLHSMTPDTFRFALKFLPALRQGHDSLRLAIGKPFFDALGTPSRWPLDQPSPFERERMLDPAPEPRVLHQMHSALARCFPLLAAAPFVETWGGMIEASPDVLPIISAVPALPGLIVATGFSGHGFGIGPGAGRLIADLVAGKAPAGEVAAFRLERFFDGSPIRPGPAI
ncbi:MAG TPA: FAD-binding oxidoreductase [Steroidobacteraceae bacterium]|nr:FAD-binding oxidoreductase [Steroidobacteraceae bacterium]